MKSEYDELFIQNLNVEMTEAHSVNKLLFIERLLTMVKHSNHLQNQRIIYTFLIWKKLQLARSP